MKCRFAFLLVLVLAGCASVPATFHDLPAIAPAPGKLTSGASLLVGPVTLPAGVDHPQLVLEQADGRLLLAEEQRWVASLPRLLAQALALDLSRQSGLGTVYAWPQPGLGRTDFSLLLDVRVFRLAPGKEAELETGWRLQAKGQERPLLTGVFHAKEAVTGSQVSDVVKAQAQLVYKLAQFLSAKLGEQIPLSPVGTF
ncbi:PqiC family protein [Vogesella alkaliphila]|uniref:ABC-type transport auxiliary lipoprotein component domain-containing protein n=1 Tax=Vogesella alkaliphila TaxID=1193621 RepID=A0ABQ2YAA5_9NEIS|nr:PqiC family protein [Vogesella alkaliphila]GGX77225.1 hypothetical protein GCM10011290_00670 [Vogesella alkaliphila]